MHITFCMYFEVMRASCGCAGFPKKRIPSSLGRIGTCAFRNGIERVDGKQRGSQSTHVKKPWKWYSTSPFICCAMDIKVLPLPMTKRVVQFKILGGESALWYLRSEVPTWRPHPTLSFCAWLGLR